MKSSLPGQPQHTFLVLDALRGVAAICVTIYHFTGSMTSFQQRGLLNADLAVDFFFILSGFVIAYAYEERILKGLSTSAFMLRRLIRLYPLYWLGMTFRMLLVTAKNIAAQHAVTLSVIPITYLFGLFFLPSPPAYVLGDNAKDLITANIFPLNHPSWSLSLEIGVNIVFVILIRHLKTPRLLTFLAVSCLAFITATYVYGSVDLGWNWPGYLGGWARVAWSFFIGVLLYRLYDQKSRRKLSSWLGIILALFLVADFTVWYSSMYFELVNCLLILPLVVWFGARATIWKPAEKLYSWLGRTSYSVYIIHMPLIGVFTSGASFLKMDPHNDVPLFVLVATVLSLISAEILDRLFDIPIRLYLGKKLNFNTSLKSKIR